MKILPTLSRTAAVLALGALAPVTAVAVPILGGNVIVASDGNVIAKFLGHTAGYTNDLYLAAPANGLGIIFTNHTSPVGSTVDLGFFTAGTELIFQIYVRNTGDNFYTGAASRNPDNLVHAVVDDGYSLTETYVGFEDLFGGGDQDYDDLNFSFTNVRGSTTPPQGVPDAGSTAGLLVLGLLALVGARYRLRTA